MDRRDFIRLVGGGVVLAAGASTASCAPPGADPRAAWDNPGEGETDIRRKALSFAILARTRTTCSRGWPICGRRGR